MYDSCTDCFSPPLVTRGLQGLENRPESLVLYTKKLRSRRFRRGERPNRALSFQNTCRLLETRAANTYTTGTAAYSSIQYIRPVRHISGGLNRNFDGLSASGQKSQEMAPSFPVRPFHPKKRNNKNRLQSNPA